MGEKPVSHSDTTTSSYLVGVVVRVANHSVHPVWFLRANGTNGCLRFGVFISAIKQNKDLSKCLGEKHSSEVSVGWVTMAAEPQPALTKEKQIKESG